MDSKIGGLAETLKSLGIVSSASDAMNLAKNIVTTEEKVSKSYGKITPAQGKTKSYQEEIDELIRKTSPEYKNYHVPVKGYVKEIKNDIAQNNAKDSMQSNNSVQINNTLKKHVFYELDDPKPKEIASNFVSNDTNKTMPELYTDMKNNDKVLKELIAIEQEDVMAASSSLYDSNEIEKNETKVSVNPDSNFDSVKENDKENDFIIEIKEIEPQEVKQEKNAEQLFKEIKVEKNHEIKNPIESVDLMNFFKAK